MVDMNERLNNDTSIWDEFLGRHVGEVFNYNVNGRNICYSAVSTVFRFPTYGFHS